MKDFKPFDWAILLVVACAALLAFLHIAFGLQRVFSLLSQESAAAWVQAIGSIAAIGIAIWAANGADRQARENARTTAKHFVRMAEAAIGGLYVVSKRFSEESEVQKVRFFGELKEVHQIGQGIPVGQLSAQLCDCVLATRTLVARCYEVGVDIRDRTPPLAGPLGFPHSRDGFSIGLALLAASWKDVQALSEKAASL